MHVGERIRIARGKLSQKEVALRAGLDTGSISRIERGAIDPTISTLQSIAGALGLTLPDLLSDSDDQARSIFVSALPSVAPDPDPERRGGVVIAHPAQRETAESVKAFAVDLGDRLTQIDSAILDILSETLDGLALIEAVPEPARSHLGRARQRLGQLRGA